MQPPNEKNPRIYASKMFMVHYCHPYVLNKLIINKNIDSFVLYFFLLNNVIIYSVFEKVLIS